MIWAFEYLNDQQFKELERLNPLMNFQSDDKKGFYTFKTFCAGYRTIYENKQHSELPSEALPWQWVPVELIDCYPNERKCVDNVPTENDSYNFLMQEIKRGNFQRAFFRAIQVTPMSGRFLTIEKTRLRVFRDAIALGHPEFTTIPVVQVRSLQQEVRRIRLFRVKETRQGFICDDWEEARILSGYLNSTATFKDTIENSYKWIPDYLSLRKDNHWLSMVAIPVAEYIKRYAHDDKALELVDLNTLMARG